MRVLIIDDDPQIVHLASFALRARGMSVLTTTDPAEGLRLAAAEPLDAVLLDVVMPELDGPAVLQALRADRATRDLPVVFFSAKWGAVETESLRFLGPRGVIQKPFDQARLGSELLAILGRSDGSEPAAGIPMELRRSFLLAAAERLDAIERALDTLQRQPAQVEPLDVAVAEFHRLSGTAASYGLAGVSDAAQHGEAECDTVRASGQPTTATALHRWRELLVEMREHLAEAGAVVAPSIRRCVRLLCVDAGPAIEETLRLLDADSGFAVELGSTCSLDQGIPDVLVLRANPSGFDLLEQVRALPQGRRTAVVMVAPARLSTGDLQRAVCLGVDELVHDASDADSLLGRVRAVVDRKVGPPPRVLCLGINRYASSFTSVIESAGYLVRIANGRAQLEIDLDVFEPDLILAGVEEIETSELLRAVRLRMGPLAAPVVLIAAEGQPDVVLKALRAGAADVLPLPLSRGLLLATVQNRVEAARSYKMAVHRDPLTGCFRDVCFKERLQRRITSPLLGSPLTLAVVESEASPLTVADLLRRRLRETDEIGRCGPGRFAIVMERIDVPTATALFARLDAELRARAQVGLYSAILERPENAGAAYWIRCAEQTLSSARRSSESEEMLSKVISD
jgi:DNA-binding response OmpR family regulator